MERLADVEQRKAALSVDSERYLATHPQLQQMIHDFVTAVLASKPSNPCLFARDYFARFDPDNKEAKPEESETQAKE